jgi:TetR/AcrR family transcriptional regulator
MNQRERQKKSRQEQILSVSLDLFVRHGYTGTSTREISRACGISSGLMFHYYESKEQLYLAHLATALDGIRMMEEYLAMGLSPLQTFREIADAAFSYFSVSPGTAKVFLLAKQAMYADYLTEDMKTAMQKMNIIDRMLPVLEAGQRAGEIREGSPRALALCFFTALESVAETVVCFPDVPLPQGEWLAAILKK